MRRRPSPLGILLHDPGSLLARYRGVPPFADVNRLLSRICWLLLLFLFSTQTTATELQIGTVTIALGQGQASALESLRDRYETSTLDETDMVLVVARGQPKAPILGALLFVNGRVALVQKVWGAFEGPVPATELTKLVFAAVESASNASGRPGIVTTRTRHLQIDEVQILTFTFQGRRVEVVTSLGADRVVEQVVINEEIYLESP